MGLPVADSRDPSRRPQPTTLPAGRAASSRQHGERQRAACRVERSQRHEERARARLAWAVALAIIPDPAGPPPHILLFRTHHRHAQLPLELAQCTALGLPPRARDPTP